MNKVIKRDGRSVLFDRNKVYNAIIKSMDATGNINEKIAEKITSDVEAINKDLNVEEIQNIIEKKLMSSCCKDAAKAYILYRNERTREREKNSGIVQAIIKRNNALNVLNSNANVDENSFSGREKEASSDIQKIIALDYNMSKDVSDAHKNGLIYHHDLDKWNLGEHNCLQIDFQEIFSRGFKTRNGDVRPPNSFSSACQLAAVAFQCQSQVQYGGVGSIHFDYDLAPFVAKSFVKHFSNGLKYLEELKISEIQEFKTCNTIVIDNENLKINHPKAYQYAMDMLNAEGKQSCEAFYHNLNTLESRQGSQVPFTSINFGRDTSTEGRLVSKWLLNASINGIGEHKLTSIFPISIFQVKAGVNKNPGDPNYDLKKLALSSMSKRIYPNFVNCNYSEAHEDYTNIDTMFSTMGCRTMIGYDRNGLCYIRKGRGNNTPITIILPKIAIENGICLNKRSKPDLESFWKDFENTLLLVEKAHLERFAIMATQSPNAAPFMYENKTIQDADKCKENVFNALKHNTFAIGYIGIAEMCQALFGENHVNSKEAREFAIKVVKRINEFASEASARNSLNFSCYATPAEGMCRTALVNLKNQYGTIKNVTDREYLTNSHHVPVWEEVSIYNKLAVESLFCKYPTGGCITYLEVDSTFANNIESVEDVIDYAFKLDIPYLAINFPIDSCLDCGYQGEFNEECPECKSKNIQQLRRVTGYLTSDWHNFNVGKQAEVKDRVKHTAYTDFGENA